MIRPSDMLYSSVVALWCLGRWTLVEGFSPVENCQQAGFLPGLLFRARNDDSENLRAQAFARLLARNLKKLPTGAGGPI